MHVLIVTLTLDPARGTGTTERSRQLAKHLALRGCACSAIAMDGKALANELEDAGIAVHLTGRIGRRFPLPAPRLRRIWRLVQGADIVHVMGYWHLLAPVAVGFAWLAGKPVVLSPAGELSKHGHRRWWKRIYHAVVGAWMLRRAASIVAITAKERDEIALVPGIGQPHFSIIPNGAVAGGAEAGVIEPSAPSDGGFYVLYVGRLAPIKGPDLLIEAFSQIAARHPSLRLLIVGPDGGLEASLKSRVRALGLQSRVSFLGFVAPSVRQALMRGAALLAIPSRSDAMSLVALEAAALGTPILLTEECGFAEIEEAGGGLVVAADSDALARGLDAMLQDPAALEAMGFRLRAFVLEHYQWTQIAGRLQEHFAEVMKPSPPQHDAPPHGLTRILRGFASSLRG